MAIGTDPHTGRTGTHRTGRQETPICDFRLLIFDCRLPDGRCGLGRLNRKSQIPNRKSGVTSQAVGPGIPFALGEKNNFSPVEPSFNGTRGAATGILGATREVCAAGLPRLFAGEIAVVLGIPRVSPTGREQAMATVKDILARKGTRVWSIGEKATVL